MALGNGLGGYQLEDKRTYIEFGASGSGQEVILTLVTAASDPVIAGASGAVMSQLLQWARERRRRNRAELEEAGAEPADFGGVQLELLVPQVRAMVSESFGTEEQNLNVDNADLVGEEAVIELSDRAKGYSYRVRVSEGGQVTNIRMSQGKQRG